MMNRIIVILAVICILLAVTVVFFYRYRQRKIMDGLGKMLEQAMNGNFTEHVFDESRQSALENQLSRYLAASELSARNIAIEKDKIKTLIADISHQTKTPISNILLYTELLQEMELHEEAEKYTDSLYVQAEKLSFLIASLVKLSRLETGIVALYPQEGEVFDLVRNAVEQYRSVAKEKGLDIQMETVKATAIFDEKWTREALCNVLDNAIKYTEKGGISVKIKPYELFVCIEITDTGIGIAEEEQAKIFTRFYRSQEVANQEGVGIGLYLLGEILAGEGGYSKVSSKPGKGSVFSIYLPRKQ